MFVAIGASVGILSAVIHVVALVIAYKRKLRRHSGTKVETPKVSKALEKYVIDPSCESAQNDIIRGSTGQVKPSPQMSDYYLELTETQYSNIAEN